MSRRHVESYPETEEYEADEYPEPEPLRRRTAPPSVHLVAILGYLAGLALLVAGVVAVVYALGGHRYIEGQLAVDVSAVTDAGLPAGALLVFGALVVLNLARKLQRGRRWARVLVLVLAGASIADTLYTGLVTAGQANVLLGLVLPVTYVVLLNTTAARSWFRSRTY